MHGALVEIGGTPQPGEPQSQYLIGSPVEFLQLQEVPQQCVLQLQSGRGQTDGPGRMFLQRNKQ